MILRFKLVLTLFFLFLLSNGYTQQLDERIDKIDRFIIENMDYWNIPGLAIGIVENDSVLFLKGYGITKAGSDNKVDEHTLFGIASNSKLFTASALAKIINDGSADWDDKVIDILPGFKLYDYYATMELSLRDLLIHRSGLSSNQGDFIAWGSNLSRKDIVERLRYLKPDYSFRAKYGYSNSMYLVAGEVIEEISGLRWDDFLYENILVPAGLLRTITSVDSLPSYGNYAYPHTLVNDTLMNLEHINLDNIAPCGAINSTAYDMTRWLRLQLNYGAVDGRQVLDSAVIRQTRTPYTAITVSEYSRELYPNTHMKSFGLGIIIADYFGYELFYHPGNIDGMLSLSGFVPEEGIGVVVLTNCDRQPFYSALFYYALDRMLNAPLIDYNAEYVKKKEEEKDTESEPKADTLFFDPLPLEQYSGTYYNPMLGNAEIKLTKENFLSINLPYHPKLKSSLKHNNCNSFIADWKDPEISPSTINFLINAEGFAESFTIQIDFDSHTYHFTKKQE